MQSQNDILNFNTSNVTIQPESAFCYKGGFEISIHLMLLFNGQNRIKLIELYAFQYI